MHRLHLRASKEPKVIAELNQATCRRSELIHNPITVCVKRFNDINRGDLKCLQAKRLKTMRVKLVTL